MPRGISLQTIKLLVKRLSPFASIFLVALEKELVARDFLFHLFPGCLLSLPVEAEEMKRTMFSLNSNKLNSNKAPGPDGYSAHFFKSAWEIVSQDVIEAIKSFFASGKLLREVNSTIIVLVPKVPNPTVMGDFRPLQYDL